MKIRGNTVGTTLKPKVALVKSENLTEEEKAQARDNIGAARSSDYGILVENKREDSYVEIDAFDKPDENGYPRTGISFLGYEDKPVRLTRVSDGIDDWDAATVGQVKEMVEQTGGGSVVIVEPIGNLKVNMTSKQIYDCILNGDTVYLEFQEAYLHLLTFSEQEAAFAAWVDELHFAYVVDENANVNAYEYDYTKAFEQLSNKVDNILPDASDEAYPTALAVVKYVNNCVGDIETALDNIISIQESLIGGAAE